MPARLIQRFQIGQGFEAISDEIPAEEPLEIQIDTRPIAVTMRTPGHDEELALGFLVSEGLLQMPSQVESVRPYPRNSFGNSIGIFLQPSVLIDFQKLTRHVFGSSSCGVCGTATIQAVRRQFGSVESDAFIVDSNELPSWAERMRAEQPTFAATGGLHAAALFTAGGQLRIVREDVGRHNAVDKIIGHAFRNHWLPLARHILMVSGRTSFEIQQKALSAGIAMVAGVGAPSSLAVDFARETGQTLVGFLKPSRFNVYAGEHRLHGHPTS